jgi:hypothetical protein
MEVSFSDHPLSNLRQSNGCSIIELSIFNHHGRASASGIETVSIVPIDPAF